jgi:hypothetical protein
MERYFTASNRGRYTVYQLAEIAIRLHVTSVQY